MMWTEPKRDWHENDYFNYSDYNRIVDNIKFLHAEAQKIYKKQFTIYDVKKILINTDHLYASMMNHIISDINIVAENTYYPHNFVRVGIYQDNQTVPNWKDLNDIERNLKGLYTSVIGVQACREICGYAGLGMTGL